MPNDKLLLIGSLPPPYHGGVISFQRVLNSEIRKRFSVEVLDISDHRGLDNIAKVDIVNIVIGLKNLIDLLLQCRKRPEVSYLLLSQGGPALYRDCLFILILKYFSHSKIVAHLHGGTAVRKYYEKCKGLAKFFLKYSISKCDRMIVLSRLYTGNFQGILPSEDIIVIPNGLESPLKNVRSLQEKDMTVSFMGILSETKGFFDYLKSAKLLASKHSDISFLVAGDWQVSLGEFREKCLQYIRNNALENKIAFLGNVSGENKERFFAKTKIFVMPSFYEFEGQPAVIIEAMAAGIPVIGTLHEAIPEIVIDKVTGFVVPTKCPEMISRSVDKLLTDDQLYERMSLMSIATYNNNYTKEKNIDMLIDLFTSLSNFH